MFSPMVPPLDRIRKYCDFTYKIQQDMKEKYGRALGCPQFCLGAEVSTMEGSLQKKIQQILDCKRRYLESAVREAHALGLVHAPDPAAKARMILAYYEGLLTQVRIQNDVEVLRDTVGGIFALLGVKETETAAV
jgi:TetR/AcrR family transcriptional repressor of nem operon